MLIYENIISGSWVNISSKFGYKDGINMVVGLKKLLSVPVKNVTEDWLVGSLESAIVQYQTNKYCSGKKMNDEFVVEDLLTVCMKNTLIPPNETILCKVLNSNIACVYIYGLGFN